MEPSQTEARNLFSSLDTYGLTENPYEDRKDTLFREAFLREQVGDEYLKLRNCGHDTLPFRCLECKETFFVRKRCDLRICPQCSRRLAARYVRQKGPVIKQFMRQSKGKNRLSLLTLTTQNRGVIPSRPEIRIHNKAVKRLVKRFFKGAEAINEVKGSNLHTHLLTYGPFIPQGRLSREWQELTNCPVVDIRQVRGSHKSVVRYLTKYIIKPFTWWKDTDGHKWAARYLRSFKGVRRIHSYGCFYNAGEKPKREKLKCPYCFSEYVGLDPEKWSLGWSIKEAAIAGMLEYGKVLQLWKATARAAVAERRMECGGYA